jgi:hypothetical protein
MKDEQQPYSIVVKHYFPQADVRNSPHHCFQNDNDNIFCVFGKDGFSFGLMFEEPAIGSTQLVSLMYRSVVEACCSPVVLSSRSVSRGQLQRETMLKCWFQSWIQQELELPNNFSGNSYRNSINPISSLHAVRLTIPLGLFYLSPSLTPRSCHPTPHPLSSLSDSTTATSQ